MYIRMTAYERFMSLRPATAVTRRITKLGRHIARASRLRRDRQLLREMPDHMLRDIGISRGDIDAVTSWRRRDTSRRSRG